ncbi:MAG: phage holin family protein [Chitinophagales bacterium]|nr:phage holin family protein [Bacteroidota bacterium]MBX7139664.1 phage holin family protein [Chitinophagales bacterium]
MNFVLKLLVNALAVLITSYLIPGINIDQPGWAIVIAAVLVLLDTVLKPIMIILTLPVTIFTFGLFLLVINAIVVLLAAQIVPHFEVESFWSALAFSLVLAIIQSIFENLATKQD